MPNKPRVAQPGKVCPRCGQIHERCLAHAKGRPCRRPRMHGGYVCHTHGGKAPQTRRRAAVRQLETLVQLIDPDRLLLEAARIATFDPRKLYDDEGHMLPPKKWPDDIAAAIIGIDAIRRNVTTGDGQIDDIDKIKVADKVKALDMLFKHRNLYQEKVEHTGTIAMRWLKDDEDESE